MRERITLVHRPGAGPDPEALSITKSGLRAAAPVEAVREDRLTLALDGLPHELAQLLQDFDGLRVRWASSAPYQTLEPLSSRLSPGLHVSYTRKADGEAPYDPSRLCAFLRALGPLDCMSPEAFTSTEDTDFYLYQPLDDASNIAHAFEAQFCRGDESCRSRARDLNTAVAVDFSFDKATEVSKVSALWPLSEQTVDVVVAEGASHRVEVGILSAGEPPNMGPRDVGMSGVLVVLGEGQKSPSPTLFKFPSRHRALPAAGFSTRFLRPTGLHPTLQISLGSDSIPDAVADDDECRPYAYLTLPKAIFADRYQLDDPLFLGSKGLAGSRYISEPVDLEAPAYTTPTWGSRVLLELARPSASRGDGGGEWTAEVPLHLRYLEPSATGERDVSVPYPVVFWACEEAGVTDAEAKKLADNPFDRTGLGYDDLFDPGTVFWHVEPQSATAGGVLTNHITVPVLTQEAESWVGPGTAIVVSLGFAWTLWKLVSLYLRAGYGSGDAAVANKDDKKKQ